MAIFFGKCSLFVNAHIKERGILGVEIKDAERVYKGLKFSKGGRENNNLNFVYAILTNKIGIFKNEDIDELKTDEFRKV
jgi:hypothetical protein